MKLKNWLVIIGTLLGIVVSGLTIYEKFFYAEHFVIEQKLDPNSMKTLKKDRKSIKIRKGITIEPE